MPKLLRRLGARDAALIVMGGIVGSGIFRNPSVVAKYAPNGTLVMGLWVLGGVVALLGASVFAELAERRPHDGGLYAYMSDAFHPVVAFVYGWTLLLVSQSGGMAAAAVLLAGYVAPAIHIGLPGVVIERGLGVLAILVFTVINALGVREGTNTQNLFMILKIAAIAGFVVLGLFAAHANAVAPHAFAFGSGSPVAAIGLAMAAILFTYSGWQTSSFMSAELKEPQRTLPRGLIWGVVMVVVLYLAVNAMALHALGVEGLAATKTPAADIARLALGPVGAGVMTAIVALSTLGFLSNQILTSPRVYFQMAADGVFFKQLAWVHPRTHVPVLAIALQGAVAIAIALSGAYDTIVNYVTSVDYVFFGLAALALIIFRMRDARDPNAAKPFYRVPGHPVTTVIFLIASWALVANLYVQAPRDTLIGLAILLSGIPIYLAFTFFRRRQDGL